MQEEGGALSPAYPEGFEGMSSLGCADWKGADYRQELLPLLRRSKVRVLLTIDLASLDDAKYHTGGNGSVNGSCTFLEL